MKRIRGRNHTAMGKIFWKALACGIAIATFTSTVSLANDIQAEPMVTFIDQGRMKKGVPFFIGDHYSKNSLIENNKEADNIPHYTYINSRDGHFRFAIPWAIQTMVWIDTTELKGKGHTVGVLLHLDKDVNMTVTRIDNVAPKGESQEQWNTTWYDTPIQGMTDAEYMEVLRRKSPEVFKEFTVVEVGVLSRDDMTMARWERFEQPTPDGPYVTFTLDMIMKADPTHRYLMELEYDDIHRYDLQTLLHLLDNFVYTGVDESRGASVSLF